MPLASAGGIVRLWIQVRGALGSATQMPPPMAGALRNLLELRSGWLVALNWEHVNETPSVALAELHRTWSEGEQGVILADADIQSWVKLRAALADDDRASADYRAVENLDTQSLGV